MEQKMYSHRGFMLDVCRHYMPVEHIKKLIKAAEICGLNRMHWHLSDDQGWRIEIKKYPKLTEIGSVRGASFFGDVSETENNCGYYTQEEAREIVSYAKECGIEIVPEIELPGHASAMLAAYPEFGCRRTVIKEKSEQEIDSPYDYKVETAGGIFPNLICAGKDEAVNFLKDIMDEIVELFPFDAVHIGGDEALKLHWRRCPDCQRRIREKSLKDEEELQRWLVLEIGEYLAQKGKSTIVFNDCLAGGMLPKHFIAQHWMGNDEETAEFMKAGGKVIYSDIEHFYFDYPYSSIDVHHIWQTPRVPKYADGYEENLLGMECMLWAERITNIDRAAYLLFPRVAAVALKATRPDGIETWEQFSTEVKKLQEQIDELGLIGAPEQDWKLSPETAEADRLEEKKRRTSPGALQAERAEERLLLQEKLEKALGEVELPRSFALQVMDSAWNINE
ncbi:MAG: family 20 glycosylhydrolase [Lachnospiraceae bacterium]|nr:family 20 glycosylhydrolase [Lachnospiraceae bacterium]